MFLGSTEKKIYFMRIAVSVTNLHYFWDSILYNLVLYKDISTPLNTPLISPNIWDYTPPQLHPQWHTLPADC